METLKTAMQTGDPASEVAQSSAEMHRQWFSFYLTIKNHLLRRC